MDYIHALKKRYSVKKFGPELLDEEKINSILEAARLSASSMGLQPYRIYLASKARTPELLTKLSGAFYNPSQVLTCSHLLILCAKKQVEPHYIDGYFKHIESVRGVTPQSLEGFRKNIGDFKNSFSDEALFHWTQKQAYIALGHLLVAAALEGIDSCPLEGFDGEKLSQLMPLNTKAEFPCVALALGIRAQEDTFQNLKKVRKPLEKLVKYL